MPKRFAIGPLGEHDDHWLTVWAALTGKSKAYLVTTLIGLRVREKKIVIQEMLDHCAALRGMPQTELFTAILANPQLFGTTANH